MMKRILTALVTLALATAGLIGITAAPALAFTCGGGAVGGYDVGPADPGGAIDCFPDSLERNKCMPSIAPNRDTYIDNRSPAPWKVYTGAGCTGNVGTIFANSHGYMNSTFNNNIESWVRLAANKAAPAGPSAFVPIAFKSALSFAWCPDGKVCLASDTNGNGTKWSYWTTSMRGGAAFPSKYRYIAASVWNRTNSTITLYDNPRCWKGNVNIGARTATNLDVYPHGEDFNGWVDNPASISSDGTAAPLGIGTCGA